MQEISYPIGNQTGEGWFLTGEMLELIHTGVNEHRLHPAICLPAKPYRRKRCYQRTAPPAIRMSNIVAIDYDPGASEVNQLNRIKLMLSTAQKNLKKDTLN